MPWKLRVASAGETRRVSIRNGRVGVAIARIGRRKKRSMRRGGSLRVSEERLEVKNADDSLNGGSVEEGDKSLYFTMVPAAFSL